MKHDPTPSTLLIALMAIAVGAALFTGAAYWWHFGGKPSSDQAVWGQFGDFFGGTLNPIFAFLSFTALVITLAIQTKQLEVSAKQLRTSQAELEATREELKRSADAQAETSLSLAKQAEMAALSAKLSGLSIAMEMANKELQRYGEFVDPSNSRHVFYRQAVERRDGIIEEINSAIDRVRSAA